MNDRPSVLVTGASSGIGRATLELLAMRGFRAFGASRRIPDRPPAGLETSWITMDVRDEQSVRGGVESALARVGSIDALVCNAGYSVFGSIEELPLERARAQVETNLFGTLNTLRATLPHMRAARRGRILVVGSLAGRAPIPFQAHYSATKAALDNLSLALRMELAPFGIMVSLIEPGDIRTPFNDHMDFGHHAASPYRERLERCERVVRESLPRAPGPELVAKTVLKVLTARRPRVRYTVGPDARLVPLARRLLPDWLCLELIRSRFKV